MEPTRRGGSGLSAGSGTFVTGTGDGSEGVASPFCVKSTGSFLPAVVRMTRRVDSIALDRAPE